MTLRLNSKVVSIDPRAVTATLETGDRFSGDLIIGADGIKSIVQEAVVDGPTYPYRRMLADPDLKGLVDSSEMINWMGSGESALQLRKPSLLLEKSQRHHRICIRGKTEYNLVLVHPNNRPKESYMNEGSVEQMRAYFEGWEPLTRLDISHICRTSFTERPQDPKAPETEVQVEDAAALDTPRSVRESHIFHLHDGPEQQARDNSMRTAMEAARARERGECAGDADANANVWVDRKKSQQHFGDDAEAEAQRWCEQNGYGFLASGGRKRRSWIVGAGTKGFLRVVCQM
ncbi:hypothetical protein B0H13DRAFT_1890919 [Mycena leptocephala]|nr:hypothetical protein B0H13DRAFT_1890919 [Mycena leptocephala]